MRKVRSWCEGGRRVVAPNEVRGRHARCKVCGQRFVPREATGSDGAVVLLLPPHKAY